VSEWAKSLVKKLNPEEYERVYGKREKARVKNYRRTEGFGSKLEAAVYAILCARVKAGELRELRRQHCVILQDGGPKEKISWKIDFSAVECETGKVRFFEAKGFEGERYRLLLKLFRANPQGVLEIWKGDHKNPRLDEVIE
jgi:hypothetical protein